MNEKAFILTMRFTVYLKNISSNFKVSLSQIFSVGIPTHKMAGGALNSLTLGKSCVIFLKLRKLIVNVRVFGRKS